MSENGAVERELFEQFYAMMNKLKKLRKIPHGIYQLNDNERGELKFDDYRLMNMLWHMLCEDEHSDKGVKASSLSKVMHISTPATTVMLNRLEELGYISRTIDKSDRRVVRINTTAKAEEVFVGQKHFFTNLIKELVEFLGEDKTRALIEIVDQIILFTDMKNNSQNGVK